MKNPKEKLDNSYLAAPVINTASDLLEALVVSQKVYHARKERLDAFAKKNPNSPLLPLLDYELLADATLFNLAEKLIENTQWVEGRLQDEFNYIKSLLQDESERNSTLFQDYMSLKIQYTRANQPSI